MQTTTKDFRKLLIFSAPSGSGKTTIVRHLLKTFPDFIEFSVSATSRSPRPTEVNGQDYYFLSRDEFLQKIHRGEFVEWEEVYKDTYYGTLRSEIDRIFQKDKAVIFDIDVVGGLNLKNQFGSNALAVFVKPPSLEVLKERLQQRNTETPEKLRQRLSKAEKEMQYANLFDVCLENSDLQVALKKAEQLVKSFLNLPE
ncbi:guanylate kinase [Thermaurantimonas aggregans]|uniref:Guanylate kinase n=1 Tax=Thermaurantimonas aggregans TaxID=2173829 RepID=A0A401XHQ0_9FLAO|nr:guanylate kinase [Thermaurantimonas aggregans]MCX8149847.1 guanylate kinase [Thermaurantimonas aggregans]GCD76533.1 guanylate kinase [Thermaurantimonas aggregans]